MAAASRAGEWIRPAGWHSSGGAGRRRSEGPQPAGRADHGREGPQPDLAQVAPRPAPCRARNSSIDIALDGQVAGHEGPGHAQLPRGPQDPPHGVDRADVHGADPVGGPDAACRPRTRIAPGRRCRPPAGGRVPGPRRRCRATGGPTAGGPGAPVAGSAAGRRCPLRVRRPRQLGDHARPPRPGARVPVGPDPMATGPDSVTDPDRRPGAAAGTPGRAYRPVWAEILPARTARTNAS